MSRDVAASIRARLKNQAAQSRLDFNLVLTRFGLERLLYRLSVSQHSTRYLLKGALLFSVWYPHPHRPTRDADLLGFGSDDVQAVVTAFKDICALEAADGIAFHAESVRGTVIRRTAGYGGVRVDLMASLDGARIALQVDIGFGDAVTPAPQAASYPVLLEDLPAPQLRCYPKSTVLAEKFHAICLLGHANTRLKDYFDLWVLLDDEDWDRSEARDALKATFMRRKHTLPSAPPAGLQAEFAQDPAKQRQWNAFIKRNALDTLPLEQVVEKLRSDFEGLLH